MEERIRISKKTPWPLINESICRYEFASKFVKGKIVVDAACGTGYGEKILAKRSPQKVFAFDLSKKAIKSAQQKHGCLPNIFFRQGNITTLPLKNKVADVFISLETIEHVSNQNGYFVEIKRVLKPEGIFICSTPNRYVTNPGAELKDKPFNPFHVFEYSQKEFDSILKKNFKNVQMFGPNMNPIEKVDLYNRLGSLGLTFLLVRIRHLKGKIHQLFNPGNFILDKKKYHKVEKIKSGNTPGYLVAVCRRPI